MINWHELSAKIESYIEKRQTAQEAYQKLCSLFRGYLTGEISGNWEYWKERASDPALLHLIPDFDDAPGKIMSIDLQPEKGIIAATDGSQIFPSRHEIAPAALVNISRIWVDYKNYQNPPLLDAVTSLYTRSDFDTGIEVPFQDLISDIRTLREMSVLAELVQSRRTPDTPVLAMTDGSLILWRLAGRALDTYEKETITAYTGSLASFQEMQVPVTGYISGSGSREVVQLLALADQEREKLYDPAVGLTDTALFGSILKEGQCSILFHSRSKILDHYGEQRISFFYLHVGTEIVKIEVPRWMTENPQLISNTAGLCYQQAKIGNGYPAVLSEAHEHAVVRNADRDLFYTLLEQAFIRHGLSGMLSAKQFSKRVPMI